MEKIKIDLSGYAEKYRELKISGADDIVITVRDHISLSDKLRFMDEFIKKTLINMTNYCYDSYMQVVTEKAMIVRYYTNVDTDDYSDEELYDFVVNNDLFPHIADFIQDDMEDITMICSNMRDAIMQTTGYESSMTNALKTSFGFLFDGKDVTETLSESEALKDQLFEAIGALKKENESKDKNKISVNGTVINLAQK